MTEADADWVGQLQSFAWRGQVVLADAAAAATAAACASGLEASAGVARWELQVAAVQLSQV